MPKSEEQLSKDGRNINAKKLQSFTIRSAIGFVVLIGFVSLFSDMTYEGGRSLVGQFLKILGASAFAVGAAAGAGEFAGYSIRFLSGFLSDKTGKYWTITVVGYLIQLFALPALALVGRWEIAIMLVFIERIGKGIRNPARDAMLSHAASSVGRGLAFGLHEAMDQIGAFIGPMILSGVIFFSDRSGREAIAGYHRGFSLLVIPACIAIAILFTARYMFPRPRDLEVKTPQAALKGFNKGYWWYLGAVVLIAAGFVDFALIAYHFKTVSLIPEYWIPIVYAISMAMDAASALFFGWLYDKKGFPILILVFVMAAFFAPLVYLGGVTLAVVGLGLWGIGMGAQESIMRAAVSDLVSPDKRGTAYGLFHTGFGISWFGGSALIGALYDWNIHALVIFSVLIQLASIPTFFMANKVKKREIAQIKAQEAEK